MRAASRIALRPFSGSTPAWAARPVTVTTRSSVPLRDETMSPFARAHSRTRQASASSASRRMCGVETGDPISSSGFATKISRANGTPPIAARIAAIACRPLSRPLFMSVTPGPVAIPPWTANGRWAAVPSSNTVSMCPMHRSVGPDGAVPRSSPTTVSPRSWSLS